MKIDVFMKDYAEFIDDVVNNGMNEYETDYAIHVSDSEYVGYVKIQFIEDNEGTYNIEGTCEGIHLKPNAPLSDIFYNNLNCDDKGRAFVRKYGKVDNHRLQGDPKIKTQYRVDIKNKSELERAFKNIFDDIKHIERVIHNMNSRDAEATPELMSIFQSVYGYALK